MILPGTKVFSELMKSAPVPAVIVWIKLWRSLGGGRGWNEPLARHSRLTFAGGFCPSTPRLSRRLPPVAAKLAG